MVYETFLSCVQILTESFPISSSGHMLLLERVCSCFWPSLQVNASRLSFMENLLGVPTLLVLGLVFMREWIMLLKVFMRRPHMVFMLGMRVLVAAGITAFFYFIIKLHQWVFWSVPLGFALTALLLFFLPRSDAPRNRFDWLCAVLLGIVQSIALLPGISRMGVTFAGARWYGLSVRRALQVSFLIQVPLLIGQLMLAVPTVFLHGSTLKVLNLTDGLGIISATLVALAGLYITIAMAHAHAWRFFSGYLIVIAVLGFFISIVC